jgi:hypothetical protein
MSKLIRNKRNNFIPSTRTPGMMFLCEIPKNKIFTYPIGNKAYVKTGKETDNHFEAICVATSSNNQSYLGKTNWLSKISFKKARAIGDKKWPNFIKSLKRINAPFREYFIRTTEFGIWLSSADLKLSNLCRSTYGLKYHNYEFAFTASEKYKEKYIEIKKKKKNKEGLI